MTRYIADFVLDSDIRLPDGATPLTWADPDIPFELTIQNMKDGFSRIPEALSAHLVFEATDLQEARERSQDILASILNALVWVSMSLIRQAKLLRIVDWSPGQSMRDALVFHEAPQMVVSEPILLPGLVETAAKLFRSQQDARTQSALRWFRIGVAASSLEDQFVYLWFALETAAEKLKSAGKVPHLCPACENPLHCQQCDETPVHRRFSADAIRDLILQSFSDEAKGKEAFTALTKIRHTLLHGRRIDSISSSLPYDERVATNELARIARDAIFRMGDFSAYQGKQLGLEIIQANDIVRGRMVGAAHVQIGAGGDPNNPSLAHVGNIKIDVRYEGEDDGEISRPGK